MSKIEQRKNETETKRKGKIKQKIASSEKRHFICLRHVETEMPTVQDRNHEREVMQSSGKECFANR